MDKILENTPYTGIHDEFPEEEEPSPKQEEEASTTNSMPIPSIDPVVDQTPKPLKEEEIPPPKIPFDFEDDLFSYFRNTSNYSSQKRSLAPSAPNQHILDPLEEEFWKETMMELTTILRDEFLKDAELSSEVIRLDSPSTSIHCHLKGTSLDTL